MESNDNKLLKTPKRIKIKKKILEFPKYMTNEELKNYRKKLNKNFVSIEEINKCLQEDDMFEEVKRNVVFKYINELKKLNKNEPNSKDGVINIMNKKIESGKNKKFLNSINRKILENRNKKSPLNLFDFVESQEKYFTHRRIKTANNFGINNNQSFHKYSAMKNLGIKNKKISKLYVSNIAFDDRKKFKNDMFLTLNKKKQDKKNAIHSSKILFNENNKIDNFSSNDYNNFIAKSNNYNIIYLKNNLKKNEEEKKTNIIIKSKEDKNDNALLNKNIYYNTESNVIAKKLNLLEKKNFNSSYRLIKNNHIINKSSNLTELPKENAKGQIMESIKTNINNNKHVILNRNYFSKTSRTFNNNKKYFLSSENSTNRNKNSFNLITSTNRNSSKKERNRRVLSTETSLSKKQKKEDFFKEITNIDEQLNNIKNDIISRREFDDNDIYKKFEEIKKKTKEDMIVSNILAEKGRVQMQSTKELFKQMKQKSFISALTKQYFTCKKTKYETSIKQKFLKELKKVDLLEKKDALLRDLAYKKNYEIRKGVNKLKENDVSKERNLFNKKTDRMKQINVNIIENFIKNMNKD